MVIQIRSGQQNLKLTNFYQFHGDAFIIQMKPGNNQNVDYVLINLMPHTSAVPSFEKALEHRRLYSAAGRNQKKAKIKDAFTFKSDSFKKYGLGVFLYFNLIQMLFYTFLIITLNSLPVFLSNFKGNGLNMYGDQSLAKSLMRFSLGNQIDLNYGKILASQSTRFDVQVSQTLIVFVDVINSFLFFIFLIFWKIKSDKEVKQFITEDALPSYYTLQIKNLPQSYCEHSMKAHFYKFGADIAQISTVYNYENVLTQVNSLIALVDRYASASSSKKESLYEEISNKLNKIRNLTKFKTPKPVISFVTFEDMIMKKKIKDLYKYGINPKQLMFKGKMLKVFNCHTEPPSILWQNYHLQIKAQIRQAILISVLLAFVLLLALLALFLANAHATSMIQKQSAFSTKFDYNHIYTLQQAKTTNTTESIFVFCSKLTYHDISFQIYHFCQPYFSSYKQKFGLMIGLSLLVVTINIILNWIICELANYRRYKTKTQKSRFLILNIFALYFINSGLLMLLIRVELGGYSLGRLISNVVSLPADQFSIQSYSDFTRKWYMNIGSQIVMIHAVSLLTSPFIQIIINWCQAKYRAFKAKRAKTQFEMNQALVDSEFDFETFYAMTLNACFFTLFHGNAIPILYLVAIGAFFALYAASYIVFRYFSCKPVMFDHTLNAVISRVMCIALIVHQITSMLYFYTDDIFPPAVHIKKQEQDKNNGNVLLSKLQNGMFFMFLAAFFIICTVNYNSVCRAAKKYFYRYFNDVKQTSKKPKLFSQIFGDKSDTKTISTEQMIYINRCEKYLSSYKMEDNPSYVNISYALKILSIFQPYFAASSNLTASTSSKDLIREIQMVEKIHFGNGGNLREQKIEEEEVYENRRTDRPLILQSN